MDMITKLRDESLLISSPTAMMKLPVFKQVVAHGEIAVTPLLTDLKNEPSLVVMLALGSIKDKWPVKPDNAGDIQMMADDWINYIESGGDLRND